MKVLLDWNNPAIMEEVRIKQKYLREQIMKRWENKALTNNANASKEGIFGFV